MKDEITSDELVLERLSYVEALCRVVIKDELKNTKENTRQNL